GWTTRPTTCASCSSGSTSGGRVRWVVCTRRTQRRRERIGGRAISCKKRARTARRDGTPAAHKKCTHKTHELPAKITAYICGRGVPRPLKARHWRRANGG